MNMKLAHLLPALLLLSSLCSCATTETAMVEVPNAPPPQAGSEEQQRAQREKAISDVFVSKSEPPFACKQLGGINLNWNRGYDSNIAAMKEEVVDKGGNYLVIDNNMLGRAYSCPKPCTPACSPGYQCVDSQCVSACNPPCKSGESCGEDRTCHALQPVGTPS
jgi:hypothetical protein